MKQGAKISVAVLFCVPLIAAGYFMVAGHHSDLAKVHEGIEREFPGVSHIDGDDLATLKQEGIVLFDVREQSEFNVSHLKNAIRVDPGISALKFTKRYADISKGKIVIFYCSVGQRSSSLAQRAKDMLKSSGAKASYNLEGGIFKWHNERRPIYTSQTKLTEYVHPYDPIWGRMVKEQKYTRY